LPPKLSIITPTLNQGAFIERTIRSVLDQGYPNLEYMIIDGGSSDETPSIIRRYEDRLAWWVSEPDEGQTDAINKGLARATGDIVAYINSDDYYLPRAFDTAVGALERSGAPWVAGAARFVDEIEDKTYVWHPEPPAVTEVWFPGRQWWALGPWSVPQPSAFWRRELHVGVGLFRRDMHYAFDTEFFLRLVYAGLMPELLQDELSVRFLHEAAKSADLKPFELEARRLLTIFRPAMTREERIKLIFARLIRFLHHRTPLPSLIRITPDPVKRGVKRLNRAGRHG
jgi:glycosyltransferase involved in cell wall biosynthesis